MPPSSGCWGSVKLNLQSHVPAQSPDPLTLLLDELLDDDDDADDADDAGDELEELD